MRRLLIALSAAMLLSGLPATASASPVEPVCNVEILGYRPC